MKIDLHIHTHYSDGENSPQEIVQLALRKNLIAIAITDHDIVAGVAVAQETAVDTPLEVISGVELSVNWKGRAAHLLGYCFDCTDKELLAGLDWIQEGRVLRNRQIIERLAELGCPITMEELQQTSATGLIGRPHFARLLIQKGVVRSMEEAFRSYLGAGARAYVPRRSMDLDAASAMLHKAGGVAVVAHPFTLGYSEKEFDAEVAEMAAAGLDGLEVFYPKHTKNFTRRLRAVAEKHNLLETGGSDYHGNGRDRAALAGGKNVFVSAHLLTKVKERALMVRNSR